MTRAAIAVILSEGGRSIAALDWTQCRAVEGVPDRVGGAWVFRGTRLPVATIIESLEELSIDEVIEHSRVRPTSNATSNAGAAVRSGSPRLRTQISGFTNRSI